MGNIIDALIYTPFSWLLLQLYDLTRNYAVALVLFALLVKVILLFFSAKGKLGTMRTQRLQPKLAAIQKQYQGNKEKINAETMKLYQIEGVSPMSGCLWMLLPFPVLIMLYQVVREPLTRLMGFKGTSNEVIAHLTELFTKNNIPVPDLSRDGFPQLKLAQLVHDNFPIVQAEFGGSVKDIDFSFLGQSMAQVPQFPWVELNWVFIIPLLSAATAYLAFWMSNKVSKLPENPSTKYMAFMSPAMSLWFGFTMPTAMSIYWIANNVFGMAQDVILTQRYRKVLDEEDAKKAEFEARRKEAEAKQKEEDRVRRAMEIAKKQKNSKKYKVKKQPGK